MYRKVIQVLLIIPILFVLVVSLNHLIVWYELSDTIKWSTFLAVAIVIISFSTIAASKISPFRAMFAYIIVFILELAGNVFHSFTNIDENSEKFKDWNDLIQPVLDLLYVIEPATVISKMRILALIQGGSLPLLGLIFFSLWLHLFSMENKDVDSNDDTVDDQTAQTEDTAIKTKDVDVDKKELTDIKDQVKNIQSVEKPLNDTLNNNKEVKKVEPLKDTPKEKPKDINTEVKKK